MINYIIAWFIAGFLHQRNIDCTQPCICGHHGINHNQNWFGPLSGRCLVASKRENHTCACNRFVAMKGKQDA